MEPLRLNPGTYAGTYKLIGGEVSFDFVNTISYPNAPNAHDWLDPVENILFWAEASGIEISKKLRQVKGVTLQKEMIRVLEIRDLVQKILTPIALGKSPANNSIAQLNSLLDEVIAYRYLEKNEKGYEWQWKVANNLIELVAPVVWNVSHALTSLDHSRFGYCGGCGWIYYDATRNRSRKWCDMEDCGSRDKALRYYHRSKE